MDSLRELIKALGWATEDGRVFRHPGSADEISLPGIKLMGGHWGAIFHVLECPLEEVPLCIASASYSDSFLVVLLGGQRLGNWGTPP